MRHMAMYVGTWWVGIYHAAVGQLGQGEEQQVEVSALVALRREATAELEAQVS